MGKEVGLWKNEIMYISCTPNLWIMISACCKFHRSFIAIQIPPKFLQPDWPMAHLLSAVLLLELPVST